MSERSPVLSPFWRNQLRQWHWISSALCLIALLLFSVTGFTLNHAAQISARPKTTHVEKDLPATGAALIAQAKDGQPLPAALRAAVKTLTGVDAGAAKAQVSDGEIYVDLTTPGVDNSLTIEDDGRGLPDGFDPKSAGNLGLQIVRTLVVGELGGTFDMVPAPDGGTRVLLDIPAAQTATA